MAGLGDPLNFIKAEDFFDQASKWNDRQPEEIISVNQAVPPSAKVPDCWRAVNIEFNDGTWAVVQFIRPKLFRVRYDPTVDTNPDQYTDASSRIVVGNYTTQLVSDLDDYTGVNWNVTLEDQGGYFTFTSVIKSLHNRAKKTGLYHEGPVVKIYLHKKPFRIQAVRSMTPLPDLYQIPGVVAVEQRKADRVVWQTSPRTFRHYVHPQYKTVLKNVVLDVIKSGQGEFIGFGEQGGMDFMKKPTYMNYFNFDNMKYQQVYNHGPLDSREPLYHSDPFWMDVNSNPEHFNVTATFIDNLSQIAIDFGKTNSGYIKIGTRFGGLDAYIITADNVPDIVRLYTAIVGRPKLKPRFILGNHQACYGYEKQEDLYAVVQQYRDAGIPLDGLHIDVDFQDGFRTFTTNPRTFPDAAAMLTDFRNRGIKCSTNITPVISINDREQGYSTLREGLEKGYFVPDKRYVEGISQNPADVRYVCWEGGHYAEINPNSEDRRPDFGDHYIFPMNYNSGYPYHGGVSYGYGNGTAGYYPDLNRKPVREWWGQQYKYLFDIGLEFVWQDMTTPAIGIAYGDMKGFPTRLLIKADAVSNPEAGGEPDKEALAAEIWALYSYNLHKATAHGLDALESRRNKRNFILGRGSFAGAYRFAGLWTGDNASTWDFWKITVSQVLSVGLNGVSIAGSDMGGFEPNVGPNGVEENYCSPELLIRWYAGSVLLPWFRNHYVKKTRKWFQEPYAYPKHLESHPELADQAWLYQAVERICKYYVELRYSLIQLLYDAMFENQINGLPIARSMLLTDTQDTSFFNETQDFLDNQYVCRRDILVAPIFQPKNVNPGENRDVYLPLGYFWYPSNLRPWDDQGEALGDAVEGGSVIDYYAPITNDYKQFPYVCPMFIREGGIIPQLQVRPYVGDISQGPNRIKFNLYPGKENEYVTYLDDGVSRSSAPTDVIRYKLKAKKLEKLKKKKVLAEELDPEAKGEYREVSIKQSSSLPINLKSTRTATIETKHNNYDPARELGSDYLMIFWYPKGAVVSNYEVKVQLDNPATQYEIHRDTALRTVVVNVKETIGHSKRAVVQVIPR
ncbi:glycosyl hydrolases family 31-domain-containing protein [Kalaharituber pfeilii]|nr:glycosyl hydrolases family 31-domain-containing protein [Kalaharituber pfeilii]